MASFATRAASVLLVLVVALCCTTTSSAIPVGTSYEMIAGVSGSSYFWTVVSGLMSSSTTVATQVNAAIQDDLQTAAGTDVTVTYTDMLINASAMYLEYTAVVAGTTPTEAELQTRVKADATFPKLTAIIASLSGTSSISDLIPTSLSVTDPLFADPDTSSSSTSSYTLVSSVEYDVLVLFSGSPSAWTSVLASSRTTVSDEIVTMVETLMNSSSLRNEVTVSEMYVLAADTDKKTMGSGAGGLLVRLSVTASATTAMTGRYLSTNEYASVLLTLDTTSLSATFQASSGSTATVVVEETTSAASQKAGDKCGTSCKAMIGMSAGIVFVGIVAVVITVVVIACPCGLLRAPRDPYAAQLQRQKEQERYAVQTDVQTISVHDDDFEGNESHQPTTIPQARRVSREPTVE